MNRDKAAGTDAQLSVALARMLEALRILDEVGAPGEIGSYLDLAIARLEVRLDLVTQLVDPAQRLAWDLAAEPYADDEKLISRTAWDAAPA